MKLSKLFLPLIVVLGITAFQSIFIVQEINQAIVLQFGDPKKIIRTSGLNFKLPFIQNVAYLDKRVLNLDFHDSDSDKRVVDAYERLFLELIKGDQWLFVSREEIETSWDWCDQIIDAWNKNKSPTRLYSAGSGGPAKAEVLIESDGRSWHGQ